MRGAERRLPARNAFLALGISTRALQGGRTLTTGAAPFNAYPSQAYFSLCYNVATWRTAVMPHLLAADALDFLNVRHNWRAGAGQYGLSVAAATGERVAFRNSVRHFMARHFGQHAYPLAISLSAPNLLALYIRAKSCAVLRRPDRYAPCGMVTRRRWNGRGHRRAYRRRERLQALCSIRNILGVLDDALSTFIS